MIECPYCAVGDTPDRVPHTHRKRATWEDESMVIIVAPFGPTPIVLHEFEAPRWNEHTRSWDDYTKCGYRAWPSSWTVTKIIDRTKVRPCKHCWKEAE